jgi:hypothetical protein
MHFFGVFAPCDGVVVFVKFLVLGDESQAPGETYGSSDSSALVKNNIYFQRTGLVQVLHSNV